MRSELPLCNFADRYLQFYDLMLAGKVVGYGTDEGGIQQNVQLQLTTIGNPDQTVYVPGGSAVRPGPVGAGFLLGRWPLIVFTTWTTGCNFGTPCPDPNGPQPLWRLSLPLGGIPCGRSGVELSLPCLKLAPGPVVPLAVDETSTVVRNADGSVSVLAGGDGRRLFTLPFAPGEALGAALDYAGLVVLVQGELRDYDPATGELLHAWPLPDVASGGRCGIEQWRCAGVRLELENASRGLVVYRLDDHIHLLRLDDGADAFVANGSSAQLEDAGLFYARRAGRRWPGRIRFVPFDRLPLQ